MTRTVLTQCWRAPIRAKQLSTVAILLYRFFSIRYSLLLWAWLRYKKQRGGRGAWDGGSEVGGIRWEAKDGGLIGSLRWGVWGGGSEIGGLSRGGLRMGGLRWRVRDGGSEIWGLRWRKLSKPCSQCGRTLFNHLAWSALGNIVWSSKFPKFLPFLEFITVLSKLDVVTARG